MTDNQQGPRNYRAEAKAAKAYAKAQRPWYRKKRFIIPIVLVALVFVASIAGGTEDDGGSEASTSAPEKATETAQAEDAPEATEAPKPKPKKAEPKAMKVQASVILKEFEGNEAAADRRYKGKTLAVTGIVDKVDTELFNSDEYVVQVADGSDYTFLTVNCDGIKQDVAEKVEVGSKVTVVGEFEDGGDLGVELKKCSVK